MNNMRKLITLIRTAVYSIVFRVNVMSLRVYGPCSIVRPSGFKFSKGLRINDYCYINASGGVRAGENLTISAGAKILTSSIEFVKFLSSDRKGDYHSYRPVTLGNNV